MEQWLLDSLLQPEAFPEATSAVHLVQTHVSYILITDNYVYKIKKPVNLGFLNFSSLESRQFYCQEELRLNRRLSPSIYLDVVEVRKTADGARLKGTGDIIDFAVKMKRLPADRMLDRLLENGEIMAADIVRIARTIGTFHLSAERNSEIERFGSIDTIKANWEENFSQSKQLIPLCLSWKDHGLISSWVDNYITTNSDLFVNRAENGFIRDCDGDLHLANICLDEEIHIFDCIEFNHRFRYSDTAADIAFLLMDLDFHSRSDLAPPFLDEYIRATNDHQLPKILDFYKIYRAFIRGKVSGFQLHDSQIPNEAKSAAQRMSQQYFRLARGYILRKMLPKTLFITCGLMGSGKSELARQLSMELGLHRFSSDLTRKTMAAVPASNHNMDLYGEGIYNRTMNSATYKELFVKAESALTKGCSVMIDASFRRRNDRRMASELAEKTGAEFCIIHLAPPRALLLERLNKRAKDPDSVSDGRAELLDHQEKEFSEPRLNEGKIIPLVSELQVTELAETVLEALDLL